MRTKRDDSGIYVTVKRTPENWKEMYAILHDLSDTTIEGELKKWENAAFAILRNNSIEPENYHKTLPPSAPALASDARELIFEILATRDGLKRNNVRHAALCAFRAGHVATRMMTRSAEKHAVTGRKVREGGKKGGQSLREEIEQKRDCWRQLAAVMKGTTNSKARKISSIWYE